MPDMNSLLRKADMKFPDRAKTDIQSVLSVYKNLEPKTVDHKFTDGYTRLCLALEGTIPVTYKNVEYNIPVALYFLENHPYAGPYCYVRPTPEMDIRVSRAVGSDGRIYLEFLANWRYPQSDTIGLIQIMQVTFSEKMPVFRKSDGSRPVPPQPPPPPGHYNPPYPTSQSQFPQPNHSPYPSATPYPIGHGGMAMPSPYPAQQTPYPQSGGYQPPYQPFMPNQGITPNSSSNSLPSQGNSNYGYNTIQASHIRDSLTTAVEDKLKNRLRDLMGTPYAEFQSIDINSQELRAGNQKLREMLENMDKEQKRLDDLKNTYTEKKQELSKALEAARINSNEGTEQSVDDAIDAATPLHRQILQCYAEDCAIDDTIYALGQALKKGNINLTTYLKHVRHLSAKQFKKRATMQKARQTAGLPI